MRKRPVIPGLALGVLLVAVGGFPATAQPAAPALSSPAERQAELLKLGKKALALSKEYNGDLRELKETKKDAEKLAAKADGLEKSLKAVKKNLVSLAQATYMGGRVEQAVLAAVGNSEEISNALGRAATVTAVADWKGAEVRSVRELANEAEKAAKDADKKIKKLKGDIKDLDGRRGKIKQLMAKYGAKQPINTNGNTPRMQSVVDEILAKYPNQYTTGCVRSGDGGDHGSGRACDFMVTSGGAAAGGAAKEYGDQVAAYAIKNADRLGIKYVIWLQRIYDMRRPGWRMMGNRGGNTANHMDHVHISVF